MKGLAGGQARPGEVRAALVAELRARRSEIEEAVLARIADDDAVDPGLKADAAYAAGQRRAVAAAIDFGLEGMERHDDYGDPSVPTAALAQARRAAREGISLERVVLRYTVGNAVLSDFVLAVAAEGDFDGLYEALRELVRLQNELLERVVVAISTAYKEERRRVVRSREERRAARVRALLAGAQVESNELDYDLDGWHLGLIAIGHQVEPVLRCIRAELSCDLLVVPHDEEQAWAWLGTPSRLAPSELERAAAAAMPPDLRLTAGEPASGREGFERSHRQAQAALWVALRLRRALTRYADVMLLATALRDGELAPALREVYLGPLTGSGDADRSLRRAARAYFAAGHNARAAAAALGVDRSTLGRRLRTIEERLGRSLRSCQPELELALRLDELEDPEGSDLPDPPVPTRGEVGDLARVALTSSR